MHPITIQYQATAAMQDRLRTAEEARRGRPVRTPHAGRRRIAELTLMGRRRWPARPRPADASAVGVPGEVPRVAVSPRCCPTS